MKLNFWQWLGLIFLVVGLLLVAYKRMNAASPHDVSGSSGVNAPSASPSSPGGAP
jgi:hypothetical protein